MRKIISFTSLKSAIKKSQYNQLIIIIHAMLSIKGIHIQTLNPINHKNNLCERVKPKSIRWIC